MALSISMSESMNGKGAVLSSLLVALSALGGCGFGSVFSTDNQRGSSQAEGSQDAKSNGSAEFSLASLHGAKKRGEPDAADKVTIKYSRDCAIPSAVDNIVSSTEPSPVLPPFRPGCEIGVVQIDLSKDSVAKIEGLKPGKYVFEATAFRKDEEIKRGTNTLAVRAREVTRGKIILHKLQSNGSVEIEIIDGDTANRSPACAEYDRLSSSPELLRCQAGVFVCTYESFVLGSGPDIIRKFSAKSECSDRPARLEILKQLCSGNYSYKLPIGCANRVK